MLPTSTIIIAFHPSQLDGEKLHWLHNQQKLIDIQEYKTFLCDRLFLRWTTMKWQWPEQNAMLDVVLGIVCSCSYAPTPCHTMELLSVTILTHASRLHLQEIEAEYQKWFLLNTSSSRTLPYSRLHILNIQCSIFSSIAFKISISSTI